MFKRFIKEERGSMFVEFVIILAVVGVIAATLGPHVKPFLTNVGETLTAPFNRTYDKDEDTIKEFNKELSVPIISISQSDNITSKTPLSFSSSAFDGKSPYTFSWSGYNGNSDGSDGAPQTFSPGNHTVSVTVTDSDGSSKTNSLSFVVRDI